MAEGGWDTDWHTDCSMEVGLCLTFALGHSNEIHCFPFPARTLLHLKRACVNYLSPALSHEATLSLPHLDTLFDRDSKAGIEFHRRQVMALVNSCVLAAETKRILLNWTILSVEDKAHTVGDFFVRTVKPRLSYECGDAPQSIYV